MAFAAMRRSLGLVAGLPSAGLGRRSQHTTTTTNNNTASAKIYELRVYDINADDFPKFMQHTTNFMHLRVKHSKLVGYWTSDLGPLNQVVHIWEYDSLSHRAAVRAALANDTSWFASYISIMRPMLAKQSSSVLLWAHSIEGLNCSALPVDIPKACTPATPPGYYRLVEASLPRTLRSRNQYLDVLRTTLKDVKEGGKEGVELYGVWFSAFAGEYNNCFSLWRAPTLDDLLFGACTRRNDKWVLDEDPSSFPSFGRLLVPCSFSDLK
eukprot:TRINITY_DN2811_c0_g1_i1.p3 TRINITY_DN2811_c0_g1~~TRINITY_DN2811_c0_g1_i1.p3  ORF type:complete len:267 (-),score=65.81 TRINITY_DN2811_c0_g1_i1:134-934(-)